MTKIYKTQQSQTDAARAVINKFTPRLRRAFLDAIKRTSGQINMSALVEALEVRSIGAAMEAVNIDSLTDFLAGVGVPATQNSFNTELGLAFGAGATAAEITLPAKVSTSLAFDLLNPRAVTFLENYRVPLIREITDKTRLGTQAIVNRGLIEGKAPITQARQIRELVGLTESQARAVVNFRQQLEQQRNRPFDKLGRARSMQGAANRRLSAVESAIVRRHMRTGNLSQKRINEMVARYNESLINRRSQNIARTESVRAGNAGQVELWRQAQDQNLLPVDVKRKWIVTNDDRLRPSHRAIPGLNRKGRKLNEDFSTLDGPIHSPPLGVNCRCTMVLINL